MESKPAAIATRLLQRHFKPSLSDQSYPGVFPGVTRVLPVCYPNAPALGSLVVPTKPIARGSCMADSRQLNEGANMASKARKAFDANVKDIDKLLELHAEQGGDQPGRRYGLEVLNKSAIVLITSFWESYCEDIAEEALEMIVAHAPNADALPNAIKKVIARGLKEDKNELAIWQISDAKWRDVLRANFASLKVERNSTFSTPKSFNVNKLFETGVGLTDMSSHWKWPKMITVSAAKKLNDFVSMRGDIAHRGSSTTTVKKSEVVVYLNHVKKLAALTGGVVKRHVKTITGQDLF